jgi:hypothetical protein
MLHTTETVKEILWIVDWKYVAWGRLRCLFFEYCANY